MNSDAVIRAAQVTQAGTHLCTCHACAVALGSLQPIAIYTAARAAPVDELKVFEYAAQFAQQSCTMRSNGLDPAGDGYHWAAAYAASVRAACAYASACSRSCSFSKVCVLSPVCSRSLAAHSVTRFSLGAGRLQVSK